MLWECFDDLKVQKDKEVAGVCAELTCGWSFGSCPHTAPEWNMRAPQSFLSIIALSSLQICRPESFTGGSLCVCVCLRLPLPPSGPITLTTTADPNQADLGFSISRRSIFVPSSSSSKLSSSSLISHSFRRACLRAWILRLKEHVHVSSPVKVTPYASCRDNEGFNFTTQAYQIAAPRSLRHALATWVIWMGRHPPFHVRRVVCTVKFAKRPHHHKCRLFQSGLQDWV